MTTSIRGPAGDRWDYEKKAFKNFNPFLEPGLISICFLSCNKYKLSKICLEHTYEASELYKGEKEWLLLEQGEVREQREANLMMFDEFLVERKIVIAPDKNYGINAGLNNLLALARGEFILIHEQDFLNINTKFNFLQVSRDILEQNKNIGLVRLRDALDPYEQWGRGKVEYEPWSCTSDQLKKAGVRVWKDKTKSGHEYLISEFPNGYNNNPGLVRHSIINQVFPLNEPIFGADPRHGEESTQRRIQSVGCAIAYINVPVYRHIGGSLRKIYDN